MRIDVRFEAESEMATEDDRRKLQCNACRGRHADGYSSLSIAQSRLAFEQGWLENALCPHGNAGPRTHRRYPSTGGRTFCITQAFFPDKTAWEKLARALKGYLDEDRFEALTGTTSLPFPSGKHKRCAVKVIDPRRNEVMRVHRLEA